MVADYERETRFELPGFHKDYGIVSGLSVPMIDNEKKVVGVMIVNRTRWHEYAEPGRRLLQVLVLVRAQIQTRCRRPLSGNALGRLPH